MGLKRPQVILPYFSYGRYDDQVIKVRVTGRIVEETKPYAFRHSKRSSVHFYQVIRLFLTRKVPNAQGTALLYDQKSTFHSNEEGFFSEVVEAKCNSELDPSEQGLITLCRGHNKSIGRFVTPTSDTHCLIISDVDDTVLKSHATSFLKLAYRTLFHPVERRKAFDDAAAVYRSLVKGKLGQSNNLMFYVSSSTWNIYPLLQGFLEVNEFPTGPIILQDIATERKNNPDKAHGHKLDRICEIAEFYPEFPLVLIGDAGQKDPEIYLEAAQKLRNRISIILIRKSWFRDALIGSDRLVNEAKELGVNMVYFEDLHQLKEELKEFMVIS